MKKKIICKLASCDWHILFTKDRQCLGLAGNCSARAIEMERSASEVVDYGAGDARAGSAPTPPEGHFRQLHFEVPYVYRSSNYAKLHTIGHENIAWEWY